MPEFSLQTVGGTSRIVARPRTKLALRRSARRAHSLLRSSGVLPGAGDAADRVAVCGSFHGPGDRRVHVSQFHQHPADAGECRAAVEHAGLCGFGDRHFVRIRLTAGVVRGADERAVPSTGLRLGVPVLRAADGDPGARLGVPAGTETGADQFHPGHSARHSLRAAGCAEHGRNDLRRVRALVRRGVPADGRAVPFDGCDARGGRARRQGIRSGGLSPHHTAAGDAGRSRGSADQPRAQPRGRSRCRRSSGLPGGVNVLTTQIFVRLHATVLPNYGQVSAYSVLLILLVLPLLYAYHRATKGQGRTRRSRARA